MQENEPIFQSIAFGSQAIEIVYVEQRDVEGLIQEYRTLVVPNEMIADELPEVFDALQQLVDHILVLKRNPPDRLRHAR